MSGFYVAGAAAPKVEPVEQPRAGEPMSVTPMWRAVVEAAGGRCECVGACGKRHDGRRRGERLPAGARCLRELAHGQLTAAPRDPRVGTAAAVLLPAADLSAWCAPCLVAAVRIAHPAMRRAEQGLTGAEVPLW